ncbi:Arginine metabolism regulation protein II [Lachnellula hyalina]|uniref:Arginine metabolism regulation protein II n=1 Tax=Lachnellula hyalina TaxID=1316788 RepID=A0A8H8R2M7_9HELO|nr:Arginine metabolism regulation protein II [Lachnellula hyalina]TVY25774.1 Arginine metabolism regulation protein II [Lachnellula hyalina]
MIVPVKLTQLGHSALHLRDIKEIDKLVAAVDAIDPSTTTSETIAFGPFAIFQSHSVNITQLDQESFNGEGALFADARETKSGIEPISTPFPNMEWSNSLEYPFDFTTEPISRENSVASNGSCRVLSRVKSEVRSPTSENTSSPWAEGQRFLPYIPAGMNQTLRQSPLATALIDNYRQNVAPLLLPYYLQDNPYSSIYIPNALIGARDILENTTAVDHHTPLGNVAMFYALLATSSFHLRGVRDEGNYSQFDVLGRFFRDKAFQYLRKSLLDAGKEKHSYLEPGNASTSYADCIMGAMLTLVTTDVMEGSMGEFWVHIDGAMRRQRQIPWGRLHTLCAFLSTVSDTTIYNLPALPWPPSKKDLERSYTYTGASIEDDCFLESTYGITSELVFLMRLTTTMSQHLAYYVSEDHTFPQTLETTLREVESKILAWSIESVLLPHVAEGDHLARSVIKLHVEAFYHALKIYFYARVTPCPAARMASYVDTVVSHLIQIEDLKASHELPLTASIMWPGFVAACEARPEQHAEWRAYWQRMLEYRIGNIATLWRVVQDVWEARRKGSLETPGWIGVLRTSEQRILAI